MEMYESNSNSQQNKSEEPIPRDYQWIFDNQPELDYNQLESRYVSLTCSIEKQNYQIRNIQFIFSRNQMLVLQKHQENNTSILDLIDMITNEILKSFELEDSDQNVFYELELDNMYDRDEKYLLRINISGQTIINVAILNEFSVAIKCNDNFNLYMLDQQMAMKQVVQLSQASANIQKVDASYNKFYIQHSYVQQQGLFYAIIILQNLLSQRELTQQNQYYSGNHDMIPSIYQGQPLQINDCINQTKNVYFYETKNKNIILAQDIKTGNIREITLEYLNNCLNNVLINEDFQDDKNFIEKIKSPSFVSYQIIIEIQPHDILIQIENETYITLNNNRIIEWNTFRQFSQDDFEKNGPICLMSDSQYEKIYVLQIISKNKVIYYNKMTQEYKALEFQDELPEGNPHKAYFDDLQGILVIFYLNKIFALNLETKKSIREISEYEFSSKNSIQSTFIGQGYIQLGLRNQTLIFFLKHLQVHKILLINIPEGLEVQRCYQTFINKNAYYLLRKSHGDGKCELYTMMQNCIEYMNNQLYLNNPLHLSLYFENSQKIQIDSSLVKLYIQGEQTMAGFFDIEISDNLIDKYRFISKMSNDEVIKQLQKNLSMYLKFISGYGNCFNIFQNNLVVLEQITKQLSLMEKTTLPILICPTMLGQGTPLEFSIKNRQQKIINLILEIILKYQEHLMYNQIIDKNLCELIKQDIDLSEYFDSTMPYYQIIDKAFPNQHKNDKELITGINLNHPKDIHTKYEELYSDKLENQKTIDGEDALVSIEYYLVNLPKTIQSNPRELMKVLSETDKPEYFENKIIQTIIKFKWNENTKAFYQQKFYIYLIFMASFVLDIFYTTYAFQKITETSENQEKQIAESQPNIWLRIITKIVCSLVLLYFFVLEVRQLLIQKLAYFNDGWNYFDFSLMISFAALCILEFIMEDQNDLILIKVLVIILSFMKLFYFLRIYDGFSFLVQMMAGVFKDLKYFIGFFLIIILQFGMIFLVLFKAQPIDEYNGVNKLAYFLIAFRISSGDFYLDDYQNQTDVIVIFSWIIWIFAVLTLNIVFMNFIIAVISESYERVMQKLVAESYKVKANMIVEREQLFSQKELENKVLFPNYIVIRRVARLYQGPQVYHKNICHQIQNGNLKQSQLLAIKLSKSAAKNSRSHLRFHALKQQTAQPQ
ncbi:wd-40 repeat protein [Stylonychia lemnae]|uniref:Wd-40 repeat protein n=1 Tax=Stylonychia lemnae TaxID=5949 RepID=A0A078B4A0_STYLE|nr:wd-40 repeat protein [Stylonychia lemnae]|eukprot:CDW88037.1 wd-40 repeat protein [Stylonychia lemnae]